MKTPPVPENEKARLEAVIRTRLLDTPPEEDFDRVTELMSLISGAPICLITLLDSERNFLKSHHGIPFNESPRDISFCGHAIIEDEPIMVVADAREDDRFHDNPLVTEHDAIFYAGVPVKSADGFNLGTLCLFDNKPRLLDDKTRTALLTLAKHVEKLYELRWLSITLHENHTLLNTTYRQLCTKHDELSDFSRILAHDIKTPVASLAVMAHLLTEELHDIQDTETIKLAQKISASSETLGQYVDELLQSKQQSPTKPAKSHNYSLLTTLNEVKTLAVLRPNVRLTLPECDAFVSIEKNLLVQILLNLVTNSIKYNDKPIVEVEIAFRKQAGNYVFTVSDNGMGMKKNDLLALSTNRRFSPQTDQFGNVGTGTGLTTIKHLIEEHGGRLYCESTIGVGTHFTLHLPSQNAHKRAA